MRREYDGEDPFALHEVLDFLAQPQRMDVSIGQVVAAGAHALSRSPSASFWRRDWKWSAVLASTASHDC